MRWGVIATSFFPILVLVNGCVVDRKLHCSLQGACEINQTNHLVRLDVARAGYYCYGRPASMHFVFHLGDSFANAFVLTFTGNEKGTYVDSLCASCQYRREKPKLLALAYLDKTNAVLALNTNAFPLLRAGKYKINARYNFNDQTNQCNFEVNYVQQTERKYIPVWEVWRYLSGGYGPGP
jgi:hypothetical protein